MKYHCTTEKFGYACRDSKAVPWALVTKTADGYSAAVIRPGFPSNGPFRSPQTAADQAEKLLRRLEIVKADDILGEIPVARKAK